jgi:hypothetical protein
MPFAAFVLPLLVLASPPHAAAAGDDLAAYVLAAPTAGSLTLAFDDRGYGDREEDDPDNVAPPDDRSERYGDDDDQDDSAHGPGDDDDGWDLNPYERTERA